MFSNPFHQVPAPWGNLELTKDRDAIIVLDNRIQVHLKDLSSPVEADVAYICGASEKSFATLCRLIHAKRMDFFEMRVADLSPLADVPNLRHLAIRWNTKVTTAAPLAGLRLEGLIFDDTPKLSDLSPLEHLQNLEYFASIGCMNGRNTARSLKPLAKLPKLRDLCLLNLKVENEGLTPLAKCEALRILKVSNQFPTEEYAFLSVHLPNTICDLFSPWVKRSVSALDEEIMVVGSRKPFLSSAKDESRIAKYERSFTALQRQFASNKALQPDGALAAAERRR